MSLWVKIVNPVEKRRRGWPGRKLNMKKQSKRGDNRAVRHLQSLSAAPYRQVLPGLAEADVSGWRNVRGRAEYDLMVCMAAPPPAPRRRRGTARKPSHQQQLQQQRREAMAAAESDPHKNSYMSGELDKSFNYVYRGGLSKRAVSATTALPTHHLPLPPLSLHYLYDVPSTVHLDPALPYPPQNQTEEAIRANWARIVASQLNSDLLVKQIVIENRLRHMQIDRDLGRLNLEGVGVDPRSIHELDKGTWLHAGSQGLAGQGIAGQGLVGPGRSVSNSSLLTGLQQLQQQQQHRKARKKRQQQQQLSLDWCTLNAQARGLGGPNVMGEKALLQTFDEPTKYRLSRLTPNDVKPPLFASPPQPAKPPPQFANRRLQELLERDRIREGGGAGQPVHVSVVSPSLGMGACGTTSAPELYWEPDSKVKHISKLRALRW